MEGYWLPTCKHTNKKLGENVDVSNEGWGSDNKHLIKIVGTLPKIIGRYEIEKEKGVKWKAVEDFVLDKLNTFSNGKGAECFKTNDKAQRHIDLQRTWIHQGKRVYQSIEVKKTTGNLKFPPQYINSSRKQYEALKNYKLNEKEPNQIMPSVYVIVSYDYCHINKFWVYTLWGVPILRDGDSNFEFINTAEETEKHRRPLKRTLLYTF